MDPWPPSLRALKKAYSCEWVPLKTRQCGFQGPESPLGRGSWFLRLPASKYTSSSCTPTDHPFVSFPVADCTWGPLLHSVCKTPKPLPTCKWSSAHCPPVSCYWGKSLSIVLTNVWLCLSATVVRMSTCFCFCLGTFETRMWKQTLGLDKKW